MRIRLLFGLTLLVCSCLVLPLAYGQSINGSISGVVSDANGAAIPGAMVKVQNTETGTSREAISNEEGLYRISGLSVGTYTITAEKEGFAKSTNSDLSVSVGTDTQANFQLGPSNVNAIVQVTDSGQLLEATQSQVSKTVDQQKI